MFSNVCYLPQVKVVLLLRQLVFILNSIRRATLINGFLHRLHFLKLHFSIAFINFCSFSQIRLVIESINRKLSISSTPIVLQDVVDTSKYVVLHQRQRSPSALLRHLDVSHVKQSPSYHSYRIESKGRPRLRHIRSQCHFYSRVATQYLSLCHSKLCYQ